MSYCIRIMDWFCERESTSVKPSYLTRLHWRSRQDERYIEKKALHRLTETQRPSYASTKDTLKSHFDPESRQTRFQVEFQTRRKKASEGWADLADDLKSLADKAYPTLQKEARERLSINAYLNQLTPQLAFSMRQKRQDSLDSAVATTFEMESYLVPPGQAACGVQPKGETVCPISTTSNVDKLTRMVEQLAKQVEQLQHDSRAIVERPPVGPPARRTPAR